MVQTYNPAFRRQGQGELKSGASLDDSKRKLKVTTVQVTVKMKRVME